MAVFWPHYRDTGHAEARRDYRSYSSRRQSDTFMREYSHAASLHRLLLTG